MLGFCQLEIQAFIKAVRFAHRRLRLTVRTGDCNFVQSDIASSYRSMLVAVYEVNWLRASPLIKGVRGLLLRESPKRSEHDSIVESARTGQWVELQYKI